MSLTIVFNYFTSAIEFLTDCAFGFILAYAFLEVIGCLATPVRSPTQ